jgi:hypothetical protein
MVRIRRVRLALALVLVVVGLAGTLRPAGAVVRCGTVSANQQTYRVRIVKGAISCRTARRVLRVFMTKDVSPRGWFCARGHASQNQAWAAACGTRAGALARAYGPVRR